MLTIGGTNSYTAVGGGFVGTTTGTLGSGTLNINGGLVNVGLPGAGAGGPGGSLDVTALWLNPYGGTASTINVSSGGTLSTTRPIQNGNGLPGATAYVNFNGGTLQAAANNMTLLGYPSNNTSFVLTVNVQAGGVTIDTNGDNASIFTPLLNGGGGGLTVVGSGMLTLSASDNYSGNTLIAQGPWP